MRRNGFGSGSGSKPAGGAPRRRTDRRATDPKSIGRPLPPQTSPLGRLARWSARNRVSVLIGAAVAMTLLATGMTQLEFADNPLDAMPRGNPHTEASQNLFNEFPGSSYASPVFVTVAPDKWQTANAQLPNRVPFDEQAQQGSHELQGALNDLLQQGSQGQSQGIASGFPGPHNITDEVYLRGMEEFFEFLQSQVPEVRWGITLPSQIKLVNYTNSGIPNVRPLQEEAFSMPDTSPMGAFQFSSAWQTYYAASLDSIKSITSADWRTTRLVFLMEPEGKSLNQVGQDVQNAVELYRDHIRTCDERPTDCTLEWNVFEADDVIMDPRGATGAAAYLTKTTLEDLVILGPIVAAVIIGTLLVAFRRPGAVAAMMLPMGFAGVGVLGIFGFIQLPIHSVSLLVFPILMGNGIDFAIHLSSAYHTARLEGKDTLDAAYQAGESAGTPLFVATMTTLAGMLLLVFAPNTLLTQLGLAILLGMALLLVVSLTALPAALSFTKSVETRTGILGRALEGNARFWNRNKVLGVAVVAILVAGALLATPKMDTLIVGTPAAYFPEGDEQRREFDHTNDIYFLGNTDLVTNVLVLEGDLVTPEAMAFMRTLEEDLRTLDFVRKETVVSLHFALNAWIQVREGTAGAPLVIAQESMQPGSTFPADREGIKELVDEMFDTPLATYASFFTSHPDYRIGTLVVEIEQDPTFDGLEQQWITLLHTIEAASAKVPGHNLEVHVAGATSMGYLFAKEELPYLRVAGLVGLAFTGFLVLAIRRSPRDAVTVASVVGGAGLVWFGALALLNIPLSIVLVVPVVIIAAIGSDYALHLRYGLAAEGMGAWRTVGRAVFFSAMTDLGAFLVFTQMRYGILQQATIATAAALACVLVATLILVPVLMSDREAGRTTTALAVEPAVAPAVAQTQRPAGSARQEAGP